MINRACRGAFGGGFAPYLTAPGVTPDLTAQPKILTTPPYFEAPQNCRKTFFFMLIILFFKFLIIFLPPHVNSLPPQVKC